MTQKDEFAGQANFIEYSSPHDANFLMFSESYGALLSMS
jgi:hypothetical protein